MNIIDQNTVVGLFKASLRVATTGPRYFTTFSYHEARMSAILKTGLDTLYRFADYDVTKTIAENASIRHGLKRDAFIARVENDLAKIQDPLHLAAFDANIDVIEMVLRARLLLKALGEPMMTPVREIPTVLSIFDNGEIVAAVKKQRAIDAENGATLAQPREHVSPEATPPERSPRPGGVVEIAYKAIKDHKRLDAFSESWVMTNINVAIAYAEAFFAAGEWPEFETYLKQHPEKLQAMKKPSKKLPPAEYYHVVSNIGVVRYKKKFLTSADRIDGVWKRKGEAIEAFAFMPADTSEWVARL